MHTATILWVLLGLIFGVSGLSRAADFASHRLVERNNAFALDLYHRLDTQGKNLFLSPYSISSAFAMCYAGAGGDTKREMSKALHFFKDREQLHKSFSELRAALEGVRAKGRVELNMANSLWAQHDHPFLPGFLSVTNTRYDANVENVDFEHHAEAARKKINEWTEEETNRRIRDIIPQGVLSSESRLVLASAIYFKGEWLSTFDRKRTRDEPFRVTAQQAKDVPTMRQTGYFEYAENKDIQMLTLPYKGDDLSMVILLPREKQGLRDLEHRLTVKRIRAWMEAAETQNVDVHLPRFTIESGFSLKDALTAMGMRDAFRWPGADFSGMDGTDLLFISEALHKAWVEVNEKGTEAAAATAVVVMVGAAPRESVKTFRADHPFLFFIRENRTGSLLFMGRVHDPSER